jgi:RNA polymerase sigma-54 factor
VRECLCLQTARAEDAPPLCLRILDADAWMLVARHDVGRMAQVTNSTEEDAREAMEWLRDHTCPYPAEDYRPEFETLAPRKKPLEKPDVVVRVNGDEIWVDCPGLTNVRLGLDPFYENLYQRIRRVRGVSLGKEEKHVTDFVDRAKLITYAIDLRGQTLHRIADHVVHYQRDLVLHGLRFVKPYTQKQVAEVLGVHESTVCRATAGKLVQLPNGETVTFDVFFDDAAPVRDLVADIIGHEDKRTPLKDGQVAEELERRGVKIARRTVAKYRDQLKILACEMRKER